MPLGDDQDVGRRLGVDVVEGEDLVVLVGDLGGDLARHDLAEEAGHGRRVYTVARPRLRSARSPSHLPVQLGQEGLDVARVLAEVPAGRSCERARTLTIVLAALRAGCGWSSSSSRAGRGRAATAWTSLPPGPAPAPTNVQPGSALDRRLRRPARPPPPGPRTRAARSSGYSGVRPVSTVVDARPAQSPPRPRPPTSGDDDEQAQRRGRISAPPRAQRHLRAPRAPAITLRVSDEMGSAASSAGRDPAEALGVVGRLAAQAARGRPRRGCGGR